MKKIIAFIFGFHAFFFCFSQDTVSVEYIKQHTYHFTITDDQIEGEGADFLNTEFSQAQFVLMGEWHDDAQIAQLTNALLPLLSGQGFRYFGIETDPYAAQKLTEFAQSGPAEQLLYQFHSQYFPYVDDISIPFFGGKEDAQFLDQAIHLDYEIFGLDQVYYSGALFLFDELLSLGAKNDDVHAAYPSAYSLLQQAYQQDNKDDDFNLMETLQASIEIQAFFDAFSPINESAQSMITDIQLSWHIYDMYHKDRNKNLEDRADYMKAQFAKNYHRFVAEGDDQPKVFLKMGAAHTRRGFTYNAVYDIGSLVHNLAAMNGTKDINFSFEYRFGRDEDGLYDNAEGESGWLTEMRPLLLQGEQDCWTIIDLRPMKADWINRKIWFYSELKKRMQWHDWILISPITENVEPNYPKGKE